MSVMFVIILISNLTVVGCMHYVYAQYGKYSDRMIMGVTLSQEQSLDEDIQKVVQEYKSIFKKMIISGYITAVLGNFLIYWYLSIWLTVWLVWMFGYIAVIQWLGLKYHKKMYALKKEKGYIFGTTVREITIDTKLSMIKDELPLSVWWFLPSVIIVFLPFLNEEFCRYTLEDLETTLILYGVIALVKFAYISLYYLFAKRRSVVYSKNSDINIACNRLTKRGYSILLIVTSFVDSFGFMVLLWDKATMGYISMVSLVVFLVLQFVIVTAIILTMHYIRKKCDNIQETAEESYTVDEDEFWASGFYNNPADSRLFVPDRAGSMNLTINYGKKTAWVLTGGFAIGIFALMLWTVIITLRLDFVETRYVVEDRLEIMAPSYSKTIEFDEIKSIRLLDELPKVAMSKQNGAATDQYALGKFYVRNQGTYYLYIYHGYSPIVELELEDMKIYLNSRQEGVAKECYEQLLEKVDRSNSP